MKRSVLQQLLLTCALFLSSFTTFSARAMDWSCVELSDRYSIETLPTLNELGTGKALKDAEYIRRASEALLKLVTSKAQKQPHWVLWSARDIIEKLGKDASNRDALMPVVDAVRKRFEKGDFSQLESFEFRDVLGSIFGSKAVGDQKDTLALLILERAKRRDATHGPRLALDVLFQYFPTGPTRDQIVTHFRAAFMRGDRGSFFGFTQANKGIPEYADLPIALAIGPKLNGLAKKSKSVHYQEWDYLGFVKDAKALSTYKKNFAIMADATSAIHFEIGPQLKNINATRANLLRIKEKGDVAILEELADTIKELGSTPKLKAEDDSITCVELFWILTRPEYLDKTIFYQDLKPIPAETMQGIIQQLR